MKTTCQKIDTNDLVRKYDDGFNWDNYTKDKEQAFRQGFAEEAKRMVGEWLDPDDETFDPWGQEEATHQLRLRVRARYTVYGAAYGPLCAGRKTYHLGYRPGHVIPAARLRGRHHALAFINQTCEQIDDNEIFVQTILPKWLKAVEQWAGSPIDLQKVSPPPRPLEIDGVPEHLIKTNRDCNSSDLPPLSRNNLITQSTTSNLSVSGKPLQPKRVPLTRADMIQMRPPDWLLRGILERDTFAMIFGEPGCGKSFLAIDWACRIATGTPWRDHTVASGPVIYIAGEGQQGFGRRIQAWQTYNDVSLTGVPLYVAPAVAIPDPMQLTELVAGINHHTRPPVLIVLDTLARNYGGGDENSTQDMSRFVSACDVLRRRYKCTVLVIHHTGHAEKNRARGAIALKAALDAEYRLEKNDDRLVLTATKMKDAEEPAPLGLALTTVELPDLLDDYDNPITSATIDILDADVGAIVSQANSTPRRGKWQKIGLEIAKRLITQSDDDQASIKDWHSQCESVGMPQSTRYDVLSKLESQGEIIVDGNGLFTT